MYNKYLLNKYKALYKATNKNFMFRHLFIDSRHKFLFNEAFIALQGENTDGHNFIQDAINNGAKNIIHHNPNINTTDNINFIYVKNTFDFLNLLANIARKEYKGIVVGITGSAGKTSMINILTTLTKGILKSTRTIKNYNNHIGLPISLINMDFSSEIGFFEIGMNHKGEIEELTKILKPNYTIITTINSAHIGNLGSIKNIIHAKAEIITSMQEPYKVFLGYMKNEYLQYLYTILNKTLLANNIYKVSELSLYSYSFTEGKMNITSTIENKQYEYKLNTLKETDIQLNQVAIMMLYKIYGNKILSKIINNTKLYAPKKGI